jgi:predicted nucleotidyltransferase
MRELTASQHALSEQLQPAISALQETLGDDLVAVVLFGSRARGDARPDSDWDLLVVARNLPPQMLARHRLIKLLLPIDWRSQLTALAKTPLEFESTLPALFLDIALDGLILHDTDDYMADRLGYVRRLLATRGLIREQRGRDFVWQWQEFPGYDWQLTWKERA